MEELLPMEERMGVGMHLIRSLASFAVAGAFAVMPRLGRGTRLMPIDPSVQVEAPKAIWGALEAPDASRAAPGPRARLVAKPS